MIIANLPLVIDNALPKRVDTMAYYPEYYEELYEVVDSFEYPSVFYSNLYTSAFMLANTKQIFPVSNRDECAKFLEYYGYYTDAVESKDFSFIDKLDEDVKYYIYDKYWAKQQGTAEIESNLPYKKIKETENYIIYDIKTKVTE